MDKIKNVHDRFFVKIFSDKYNIKSFLKIALPTAFLKLLDFSKIEFDLKSYITGEIKGFFFDMVIKMRILTEERERVAADIYFLFEHKSYQDKKIFIQLLKYMYLMWQKDADAGKSLRVIIPIVFYHGKPKWTMSQSFSDQFNVNKEIKEFLTNYKYILFDTNSWDLDDKRNEKLRDNVNLIAYLFLMKSAFHKGLDAIKRLIEFWHEKDLVDDVDLIMSSLNYIVSTQDIAPDELIKILVESEIQGGEIMPSLAQRWIEQGIEQGIEEGIEKGVLKGREEGIKEGKIETAKELIKNGVAFDIIARSTGLSKKEIEKLAAKTH
jgi:predicted transposase/invertase (TIGR01784 family)